MLRDFQRSVADAKFAPGEVNKIRQTIATADTILRVTEEALGVSKRHGDDDLAGM